MNNRQLTVELIHALDEHSPQSRRDFISLRPEILSSRGASFKLDGDRIVGIDGAANHLSVTQIVTVLGPAFGAILGSWLTARYGRKVRIKVGDVEAEARTLDEVEKLLGKALEIQERKASSSVENVSDTSQKG